MYFGSIVLNHQKKKHFVYRVTYRSELRNVPGPHTRLGRRRCCEGKKTLCLWSNISLRITQRPWPTHKAWEETLLWRNLKSLVSLQLGNYRLPDNISLRITQRPCPTHKACEETLLRRGRRYCGGVYTSKRKIFRLPNRHNAPYYATSMGHTQGSGGDVAANEYCLPSNVSQWA